MKAYDYSCHDKLVCRYKDNRLVVDKTKRKTARRFVCDEINED
jgi:hypothetical protein